MHKLISIKMSWLLITYALLDIICVGLGMGVPFFCILFGFPVGFYIGYRLLSSKLSPKKLIKRILQWSGYASGFTTVLMLVVWGLSIRILINHEVDLANFGHPMILYEPLPSFIGWMVLMIFISPFLQFLMSLFGAYLGEIWGLKKIEKTNSEIISVQTITESK